MAAKEEKPEPEVTVSGDADGGWIVEVHDGDRHEVYTSDAKTEDAARNHAMRQFNKAVKDA